MNTDNDANRLRRILQQSKTIAVVGLSPKSQRPSYSTAAYMQHQGYRIIPVNPNCETILGESCYASLRDIPEAVDMVNCFRRADEIPALAEQALALGVRCFWVQLGIRSPEARRMVTEQGVDYVQDHCLKIEHARLLAG